MKKIFSLLALVLFINLFTYQAQAQTAVVNINKTSVSLKELIQEVEKQAGYLFVYGKDINIEQKVKINARNKQVKALLENVLPQIGLTYEYADNYISLKKTQVEKKSIGKNVQPVILQAQEKLYANDSSIYIEFLFRSLH